MVTYLLNSMVIPINFDLIKQADVRLRTISVDEAIDIIKNSENIESAIGHEATAKVLSALLMTDIPYNRRSIYMSKGDRAIHFYLKTRLPEGMLLDDEQLKNLDYWLVLSEIL